MLDIIMQYVLLIGMGVGIIDGCVGVFVFDTTAPNEWYIGKVIIGTIAFIAAIAVIVSFHYLIATRC